MKITNGAREAVAFNGYVNQYTFSPIRAEPAQRIRTWVLDPGPPENSSFHSRRVSYVGRSIAVWRVEATCRWRGLQVSLGTSGTTSLDRPRRQ